MVARIVGDADGGARARINDGGSGFDGSGAGGSSEGGREKSGVCVDWFVGRFVYVRETGVEDSFGMLLWLFVWNIEGEVMVSDGLIRWEDHCSSQCWIDFNQSVGEIMHLLLLLLMKNRVYTALKWVFGVCVLITSISAKCEMHLSFLGQKNEL